MIVIYILLGIYYLINILIFITINAKKQIQKKHNDNGIISLLNDDSLNEPLFEQLI